jgi:Ca-activated chloride channel homolog
MTRLVIVLAAVPVLMLQDQRPKFRSGADAVRVDVQARQGNRPVAGLTAEDFEVRDTGVLQTVQVVASGDAPLTLLLALDTSSSVEGEKLQHLKAAARSAVSALTKDDRATLITFTERVAREAAPTADRAVIGAAIDRMSAAGATGIIDAVLAAIALRHGIEGRVVLLVFTDGMDTISWLENEQVLDAALRSDLVAYSVAISSLFVATNGAETAAVIRRRATLKRWFESDPDLFSEAFLEALTKRTGGESFYVQNAAELAPAFARIVADFKTRYLLTYSPKDVPPTGWHPIEVKLKNRRGTVQARRGYWR